ncbi:high affinity immunoglobulin gamma Fc receptor I-like isoform X2 [Megalobrama amblycephala]|uniref:high affinity immunoglobulin gamma Fc receptor I-like isoform X2 n=1 Tax=Megalobrama amblycephala TaxID=75352 RepID=UPI002014086A|nr:high affinity immunoglobulin gamma Fc receptor I-like isoform X2 [Megalobrama amblycephala]
MMDMRFQLTLSVLLALIREDNGQSQNKPTVSLLPRFPDVFVGDDITLICKGGSGTIKWFINEVQQSHQDSSMVLTAVTSKNRGRYECERGNLKSDKFKLTVLELEPHAQLFPSIGGAVMSKGDGRNLVLQVDDDPNGWACFVLRGENGFRIQPAVNEKRTVIFAELKEENRATFWCKKGTQRSNAVTLKMTELRVMLEPPALPALLGESVALRCVVWGGGKVENAVFFKDTKQIANKTEDTYIITSATQDQTGKYSCRATYRYSHISPDASQQKGDSDAQELKFIGGPPAATVDSTSTTSLRCSCNGCPADCTSYRWYRTPFDDSFARKSLSVNGRYIDMDKEGMYSCRMDCGKGFSRFSNVYRYKAEPTYVLPIMAAILMVLGVLIVVLVVLKCRKRGESSVQTTERDKDKRTGGVYEHIQLTDQADKDKGEGQGRV